MPTRYSLVSSPSRHAAAAGRPQIGWRELPPIPDSEGFAGSYAGTSGNALIVAGGANFPGKRPWEGGEKVWYDRVFVLEDGGQSWREAGSLPQAGGYGSSVQLDDGVLLIGGGDARRHFAEVWLARWDGRRVDFEAWPALPIALAMTAAARVGHTIYLAGGLERPDAAESQRICLALDLGALDAGWREVAPWPGPERMLATAGCLRGEFLLCGGARMISGPQGLAAREWLRDAYALAPETGWRRVADLPRPVVAAPSPAVEVAGRLLVIGGDDGAQVAAHPAEHQGFPRSMLAYDPDADLWTSAGDAAVALVTTTLAVWKGHFVIPGGEQRPGVRSPAVWAAAPYDG